MGAASTRTGFVLTAALAVGSFLLVASPADAATSNMFAGYTATATSPVTTFSGTITAPSATCPASGQLNMFMETSLLDPSTFDNVFFGEFFICNNGQLLNYIAEASVNLGGGRNATADVNLAPGDVVKFSMIENAAKGTTTATVNDVTTGLGGSATGTTSPSLTQISAETSFCEQSPVSTCSNVSPIPTFTSVKYANFKFNGAPLSALSPTKYNLYNGSVLQVSTSAISTSGSFSTIFKHN